MEVELEAEELEVEGAPTVVDEAAAPAEACVVASCWPPVDRCSDGFGVAALVVVVMVALRLPALHWHPFRLHSSSVARHRFLKMLCRLDASGSGRAGGAHFTWNGTNRGFGRREDAVDESPPLLTLLLLSPLLDELEETPLEGVCCGDSSPSLSGGIQLPAAGVAPTAVSVSLRSTSGACAFAFWM